MRKHNVIMTFLAFLLPFLCLCAVFAALRITPFGSKILLLGDADGYYVNYLVYIREILNGNASPFYSFTKGLGGNVSHLSSFYLYRIDTLFYLLAGWEHLADAFSASVIFNTSLCGLTMYLFLSKVFGHKPSNLIFSTSYAFMGFVTVNNYNVVFAMGPVLLPLVILGLYKMYKGESPHLYIFSLSYSILTLFQMGFILCTASLLFFIFFIIIKCDNRHSHLDKALKESLNLDNSKYITKKKFVFNYFIASLSAGLLGAIVWFPALKAIMGRVSQGSMSDYEMIETVPILSMGARLFSGAASTSQLIDGYPAIYCGILPLVLTTLYFLNKEISKKEKYAFVALLIIYIMSFYIKALNNIFQGFGHVNWFNFRQSFVFTFILLLVSAKEFEYIATINKKDITKAVTILLVVGLIIFSQKYEFVSGAAVVLDYILLAIMCGGLLLHIERPDKADGKSVVVLLIICTCFQMYCNYYFSEYKVLKEWGQQEAEFQQDITERLPIVQGIQSTDQDFYRMENENQRRINDPMMFLYNGVSHMSYENNFILENTHKLGVSWRGIQGLYYDKGIPASMDSFLGLKYIISKRDLHEEKNYIPLGGILGSTIYKNPFVLPIAIVSNEGIEDVFLESEKDIFELQNQIWKGMTGEKNNLFIREEDYIVEVHNPTEETKMTSNEALGLADLLKLTKKDEKSEENNPDDVWKESKDADILYDEVGNELYPNSPYLEISFNAKRNGAVYLYDSSAVVDTYGTEEDVLKYLGNYKEGELVKGRIYYSYNVDKAILADTVRGLYVYYADMNVLSRYSDIIQNRSSTIVKEKDTFLTGEVTLEDNQLLLFTIPYDEGWTLYVDGKAKKLNKTIDLLMSAKIPSGTHSYEMKYTAPGLKFGAVLSIIAAVTTIIQFFQYKRDKICQNSDLKKEQQA